MMPPGNITAADSRELIEINGILVLIALYLSLNIVAACAFAWDKRKAKRGAWRTSEGSLLVLGLLGPFGAFIAMRLFRHKMQKAKFRLVPLFLVLHCVVIMYVIVLYR